MASENDHNITVLYDNEDHTLGNLIRHKLLSDPSVIFAAYNVPHPLKRTVEVRVQTVDNPAQESIDAAIENTLIDIDAFEKAFSDALSV